MAECPMCTGWEGELDLAEVEMDLCGRHVLYMRRLDEMIEENRVVLGRLNENTRMDLALSLEQMRRGEGQVIRPEELREGDDD